MRAVIQRVSPASVYIDEVCIASINKGLLVLLGVGQEDGAEEARSLALKIVQLRIFSDAEDKMNLSVLDVGGEILVVSQFTLWGDCRKGRRPAFTQAAPAERAQELYLSFVQHLRNQGMKVATGRFQANMQVHLVNDGPVTLWLETGPSGR